MKLSAITIYYLHCKKEMIKCDKSACSNNIKMSHNNVKLNVLQLTFDVKTQY